MWVTFHILAPWTDKWMVNCRLYWEESWKHTGCLFIIWHLNIFVNSLFFKAVLWNFHSSFHTFGKFVRYTKVCSMWCPWRPRTLYKRKTKFFRTLMRYFLVNATIQVEVCFIGDHVTFKTPGLSTSSAPYSLVKGRPVIPSPDNGWLSSILCGNNDRYSRHISHAVLIETPICCAKRRTLFLEFLLLPPALHWKLLPYEQVRYIYVPSHVHHTHLLFLKTCEQSDRQCLWTMRYEQKNRDDIFSPQQRKIHQKMKWFW
jgi:hypothetical protein